MNQITNLLVLLIISSLFLPATAIMYASGSTSTDTAGGGGGDEDTTSDTESTDTTGGDEDTTSDTESTDTTGGDEDTTSDTESTYIDDILESASTDTGNETSDSWHLKSNHALDEPIIVTGDTLDSAAIENNATLNPLSGGGSNMTNAGLRLESNSTDTSTYPVYCAEPCIAESNSTGNSTYPVYCSSCNLDIYTGGGDLASMILAGHNRVRAQVGVAPLVWNDSLAAAAQTWADHLAAEGRYYHDPDPNRTWGENIAARSGKYPNVPAAHLQEFFFSEMNNYHGQTDVTQPGPVFGHYTQSVWNSTTSVGCAHAINGDWDYLVCRYDPPGNTGRPAY